jgi:hypothetical protein
MHGSGFLRVFLIISAISLLLDWYVFSGLRTLSADWQSPLWRNIALWGFLVISVGVTMLLLIGFGAFSTASGMRPFHEWILSLFLTFFVTKLVFVIVLSSGDLGRFIVGLFNMASGSSAGEPAFPARRKFISEIAILVAAVPFTSFFYAMFKGKYDYKLHRTTLYFDDLPDAFDGFTITQRSVCFYRRPCK